MDLNDLIPNNNPNWEINNDVLYFKYHVYIPILTIQDEKVQIILDNKVSKHIITLIKFLQKRGIKFFFSDPILFNRKNYDEQDIIRVNILNYLFSICSSYLYTQMQNIGFDYVENLSDYILENDAHQIFKEEFEFAKKKIFANYYDYFAKRSYYEVEREDIRNFIAGLERQIKINWLL